MALKVFWSKFAEEKLLEIFEYNKLKANIRIAARIRDEIIESTFILAKEPFSGQKEDILKQFQEGFRYLICRHFKIIYWVDKNSTAVYISTVFDCRQNPVKMKNFR